MEELKVGKEIYFEYSKWYPFREGVIDEIKSDGTYRIAYLDGSKTLYRDVKKYKIATRKPDSVIKKEEQYKAIDEICHKIWIEFDVEIPFLSRPTSLDEAQRLYKRLKRERYSK